MIKKQQTKLTENNPSRRQTVINANKQPDLAKLKLMKAKSATTSPANMGANRKSSGPQEPSKTTPTTTITTTTTTTTTTNANDKTKLIKKAYVRFDDYLDLNEENMRRSCKRLMNHLYSESNSMAPPLPIVAAPAISCRPAASSPSTPKTGAGLPIKSPTQIQTQTQTQTRTNNANISNRSLPPTPLQQQQSQQQATGKGKSYLRSQYERRQLRQLELMQQEQFTTEFDRRMHSASGANARRQQQDLVVARSHELSKRRFFEKLERRELIKNSNLAQVRGELATGEHAIKQQMGAFKAPTSFDDHRRQINQETSDRQKNLAATENDEITLDVYQSIVPESNRNSNTNNNQNTGQTLSNNKEVTLGQLAGTQVRNSPGELIGFYTPSPNLPNPSCSATRKQQHGEQLIEFSAESAAIRCCKECSTTLVAAVANQSAFEIKVPAASSSSRDRNDGFISSGLLVVKQVEVATEFDGVSEAKGNQLLDLLSEQQDNSTTLCGRHQQQIASAPDNESLGTTLAETANNKTKAPLTVDGLEFKSTDKVDSNNPTSALPSHNNAQGAEDSICRNLSETMAENSDDQRELPEPLTPSIASSDNQQQVTAGASLAISRGSNNNSNEMKKISSIEANEGGGVDQQDQTTGKLDRLSGKALLSSSSEAIEKKEEGEGNEVESKQVNLQQQRRPVCIEVGGETNRSEDHEVPEMAMLPIGQSGGAKESPLAGVDTLDSVNSAYPVQTQSAAPAQQQVAASLQTTITKMAVRDVPPEANGINPIEAIVSEEKTGQLFKTSNIAANDDAEKVIVTGEQVNEENYGGSFAGGYANPAAILTIEMDASELVENNVNHDVVKQKSTIEKAEILSDGANIDSMGGLDKHLIEPLRVVVQHSKQAQRSSSNNSHSVNEEDGGSSCSSSGFGASVSVTSSLDGSNSINDTVLATHNPVKRQQVGEHRRPTSLALATRKTSVGIPYEIVGISRQNSTRTRPAKDFPGYKELVGPDQAYPSRGLAMLIENESYSSVLNRSFECISGDSTSGLEASIVLENDEGLLEGYANLPRSMAPLVEYATVGAMPTSSEIQQVNNNNSNSKKYPENAPSEASSSSGRSYSTSSANSGGFSALPPAQVEQDCSASNNFESLVSLSGENSQKKSSLLKRFGSYVSKAFIGAANAQSVTPKINEPPSNDFCESRRQQLQQPEYNANIGAKSVLVIEADDQADGAVAASSKMQVNEADLVILPTKSSLNQQQRKSSVPQNLHHHHQQQHQFEQNSTGVRRSLHDDRLSRGKKHSRKLKQQPQADSSSVTFTSSSSTFSSSESSLNVRHLGGKPRQFKLKKADSLSEELESLMSRSNDEQPNNQRKSRDFKKLIHRKSFASGQNESLSLTSGCIDIDCVSPTSKMRGNKLKATPTGERLSESGDKSASPRSLIRLFHTNASSNRAPNSGDSSSKPQDFSHHSSQCKISTTEAMKEHSEKVEQPISGFWGFSSLIGYSHAITNNLDSNIPPVAKKTGRKVTLRSKTKKNSGDSDDDEQDSLVYSNLRPFATGYRVHASSHNEHAQDSFDKHHSLGFLHQDLLRKRNHRHSGSHHHHRHHHHHHHNKHHSSTSASRHAHYLAPPAKCTQSCGQNCHANSGSSACCCEQVEIKGKPVVWGQLIKINKSDGSQVIELQRAAGKSWGFFVARGAINNVKGIFISRMHDTATSNSLTGLLSIGDRILAIDELTIEPDYDILRVNQMISKKSKILLKVKPFKG